jgi:hypothetical protein
MSLNVYLERFQRLNLLISRKATGTPKQLAYKLGISKRMLHEYLLCMKDLGAEIHYCRQSQSYVYTNGERLEIKFNKKS